MAAAFTLTMAYLAENYGSAEISSALAAYITGVVTSNLVGRLMSAAVADLFGLGVNFYMLAGLNLAGALLVLLSLDGGQPVPSHTQIRSPLATWAEHLRNPALLSGFGLGFLILFAFIGIFTCVNFVLTDPPIGLGSMSLGLVYFVFLPSMMTTPLAGRVAAGFGLRETLWASLGVAAAGLPLLLVPTLSPVLAGMVLVGVGTFFAQAIGTGFIGRAAMGDRAAASGLYLASCYLGGLAGAAILGQVFNHLGWTATVAGVAVTLALGALLAFRMRLEK